MADRGPLRVLSMVEGTWVTGPIKPLMMLARLARSGDASWPAVNLSLMTTVRIKPGHDVGTNALLDAAADASIGVDVLRERRAWDLKVLAQLRDAIERHRPDIVETHQVKCHFMLAQALLWRVLERRFSWIAYHHGYTNASLKLKFYESLDRWSLRLPDQVVTVCRPFAAELVRRGAAADRMTVVPNAVEARVAPDPGGMEQLRQRLGIPKHHRVVLAVGRLSPEKGHLDLIQAFGAMLADPAGTDPVALVIVGDGPEKPRLQTAARSFASSVFFAGHQQDVWPYYFLADVFALPSHTEGSPLVLFEAMAAGLAIVATRVGGIPETLTDGQSASLVAARDVKGMANALAALLKDTGLRKSLAHGARMAGMKFTPEAYCDRVMSVYAKELSRRPEQLQQFIKE